jgi:tRNA threonylcarbamoyladenosine biosynthesis protein TsaB
MSQLVLAVDTSGKNGSVALTRGGPAGIDLLDLVRLDGGAFSAQLIPQIALLLGKHKYTKGDLEAFVVASGPGSFTGLRVGLAAIKALGEALQKPIVAVSLLEIIACSGSAKGKVLAVLDAGRGDVYVGDYEVGPEPVARLQSERLLSAEQLTAELGTSRPAVVTPDALLAQKIRTAGLDVELIEYPDSHVLAQVGWAHLKRGAAVLPEKLEANYLRRSDAEIFSKPAR